MKVIAILLAVIVVSSVFGSAQKTGGTGNKQNQPVCAPCPPGAQCLVPECPKERPVLLLLELINKFLQIIFGESYYYDTLLWRSLIIKNWRRQVFNAPWKLFVEIKIEKCVLQLYFLTMRVLESESLASETSWKKIFSDCHHISHVHRASAIYRAAQSINLKLCMENLHNWINWLKFSWLNRSDFIIT